MIHVAIFEDKPILRESLVALLEYDDTIACSGAWENCQNIDTIMQNHYPDVVLMDIDMPVSNGLEGLAYLQKNYPKVIVIMLTVFEDDKYIFESLTKGAKGYLLKNTPPDKILEAIHDVYDGGSPMSSSIARKVIQTFSIQPASTDYALTPREKDILSSLVKGNSYKLIAVDLNISINTVRQYIRSIYEKLQVHSMNEAVAKALNERILN